MNNLHERRTFLQKFAFAASGVALLSSTSILQAFSSEESPFAGYNPYADDKTDLRTSRLFGNHITVKGKIVDKNGLNNVPFSKLEVWHLSPNSKKYRHMAKMTANENGEYQFITDFPNREPGRYAKVYFKVTAGDKVYFTELSLSQTNAFISGKHWEENQALGKQLFPTFKEFLNEKSITFNISV